MFNYYHYQPGSNIIIVYCKHITHAHTHARTNRRTYAPARTRAYTHPTHKPPCPYRYSMGLCKSTVTTRFPRGFECFSHKKMQGRTDTRTRERMYSQTIRTVRYISRYDRAIIATCSLRTPRDRLTDLRKIIVCIIEMCRGAGFYNRATTKRGSLHRSVELSAGS